MLRVPLTKQNHNIYPYNNHYLIGFEIVWIKSNCFSFAQRTVELMQKSGNREYYNTVAGEGLGLDPFRGWSLLGHFFRPEKKPDCELTTNNATTPEDFSISHP
jgi:hypothetical protein